MARYYLRRWLGYPTRGTVGLALASAALQLGCAGLEPLSTAERAQVAASRHLALGYAEGLPLPIWLLGAITSAGGASPWLVRLLPAVASAVLVFMVAATVRRLEGSRFAQALAALGAVVAPGLLAAHHEFGAQAFAPLMWTIALLLVLDICGMRRRGGWIALGVLCGIGAWITPTVVWLVLGLGAALVATRERRWIPTPWPWGGLGICLAIAVPVIWWQAMHGWPIWAQLTGDATDPLHLLWVQISALHPVLLPVWLGGLGFLCFGVPTTPYRPLAWPFLATAAITVALVLAPDALVAASPTLLAAGALWVDRVISRRGRPGMRPVVLTVVAVAGLLTLPLALPVLPQGGTASYRRVYTRALPIPTPTTSHPPPPATD